jgi:hypothetical protein
LKFRKKSSQQKKEIEIEITILAYCQDYFHRQTKKLTLLQYLKKDFLFISKISLI